jgi:hypothetical protein
MGLEGKRLSVREIQFAGGINDIMHLVAPRCLETRGINSLEPVTHYDVGGLYRGPSFTRSHRTLNLGWRSREEDVRQARW